MSEVEPADATTRAQLLALEQRRRTALIAADTDALDELFDDALVHIHAPGVTHDKAQLLEHVSSRHAYLDTVRGELNIRLVGDIAIMTGPITNRLRNPDGSERVLSGVATQVLRRDTSGRWLYVSFQMTPAGEQVWPALASESGTDTTPEEREQG